MIKGELLGGDQLVSVMKAKAPNMQKGLASAIGRLVLMLQRNVKQDKLSGQSLKVKSGRLRRSINAKTTGLEGTSPEGTVGTNVVYARPHEYGFDGTVPVKAHMRTIKQAFGKAITPVSVQVAAHSVHMKLPEKSFLRSALADLEPTIRAEVDAATKGALK